MIHTTFRTGTIGLIPCILEGSSIAILFFRYASGTFTAVRVTRAVLFFLTTLSPIAPATDVFVESTGFRALIRAATRLCFRGLRRNSTAVFFFLTTRTPLAPGTAFFVKGTGLGTTVCTSTSLRFYSLYRNLTCRHWLRLGVRFYTALFLHVGRYTILGVGCGLIIFTERIIFV